MAGATASTRGSPDADAKWGRKSRNNVDADSGMITTSVLTPGNERDGVVMSHVLDQAAEAVVADKAYDLPRNHQLLASRSIDNRIIRKKGDNGSANSKRYVVERTNAVVKRWCGGGRARYWGVEKVGIQMTLACIAANLKRWLGMSVPVAPATG